MKITAKVNKAFDNQKKLKAFVNVYIDNDFLVTGVRVLEGKNGLVVLMPSKLDTSGEFKDICFPLTKEVREQVNRVVLNAYDYYLKKQLDE